MNCTNPIRLRGKNGSPKGELFNLKYPDGLQVPCGKCLQCRIKKRKEWAMRLSHELQYYDKATFITLTYDENTIDEFHSLHKKHLQLFFKRLRKRLENEKIKIRYFACGEYGDQTGRPHYHAIIYGIDNSVYCKSLCRMCWRYGHIFFGSVTDDSMSYVAQYIDKKYTGDLAVEQYVNLKREPVFKLSSLGIGKQYCLDSKDQIKNNRGITFKGKQVSIPRYYLKKLGLPVDYFADASAELEEVYKYTDHYLLDDDAYRILKPEEYRRLNDGRNNSKQQREHNIIGKLSTKRKKL